MRAYNHKIDHNHAEIVQALKSVGALIIDTSMVGKGGPDLICQFRKEIYLIEIKNPKTGGKLNKLQEKFHEEWAGSIYIVHSVEEALQIIGAVKYEIGEKRNG